MSTLPAAAWQSPHCAAQRCEGWPARERRRARRGLTLLELMLVLALLVVIASFATPTLFNAWENQRLRQGADLVRAAWGRARAEAMRSGEPQVFRYASGGGEFRVEPWSTGDVSAQGGFGAAQSGVGAAQIGVSGAADLATTVLPESVTIVAGRTQLDVWASASSASAANMGLGGANMAAGGGEDPPVLFYPDGTTSTAELVLCNSRERYVVLTLRGLTGAVRVSELVSADDLPQ